MFSKSHINARIIKIEDQSQGCTHGVEISDENLMDCVSLLRKNNIKYQTRKDNGLP